MFAKSEKEKAAINELAQWAQQKGMLNRSIDKNVLIDPIRHSAKLFSNSGHTGNGIPEYIEFIHHFQSFVTEPNFEVSSSLQEEWTRQSKWLRRILWDHHSNSLEFMVGEANWNYWDGNNRISKPIPILKLFRGNNEMMIANFEDDERDYVRHRILLIENTARESAGSAFSTFNFLKAVRRYLIVECGVNVLHGKALENELDIPMRSEWRTKQATTLTFSESVTYSVSRLEKYWARSGSFYLLPNLYGDPSKLMLVMLSNGFKTKLLHDEPSWRVFTDYCDNIARKTEAA